MVRLRGCSEIDPIATVLTIRHENQPAYSVEAGKSALDGGWASLEGFDVLIRVIGAMADDFKDFRVIFKLKMKIL